MAQLLTMPNHRLQVGDRIQLNLRVSWWAHLYAVIMNWNPCNKLVAPLPLRFQITEVYNTTQVEVVDISDDDIYER